MNNEIKKIFSNFIVDNQKIPVEWQKYLGTEETYVVYSSLGEKPELHANDIPIASVDTYDFDIYSKSNYLNILKEIKNKLISAGWTWIEDSEDLFEEDTGFYHKITTWCKEKGLI